MPSALPQHGDGRECRRRSHPHPTNPTNQSSTKTKKYHSSTARVILLYQNVVKKAPFQLFQEGSHQQNAQNVR